jgi:hypothetical protein
MKRKRSHARCTLGQTDPTNDDKAKGYANAFVNGHDVELWELNRMVAVLKADDQ